MTSKTLTRRQEQALQFIKSFITKNTYSPTVREIAENLDLKSHSTAFCLLEQIVSKGYIKKGVGPRMIQVVDLMDKQLFSEKITESEIEEFILSTLRKHGISAHAEMVDFDDEVIDNRRAGRIELIFDVIVSEEVDQL